MPEDGWVTRPLHEVVTLHEPELAMHDPDDDIATVGIRWYGMGLFAKPAKRSDIKARPTTRSSPALSSTAGSSPGNSRSPWSPAISPTS
jgi:hypothetical protein